MNDRGFSGLNEPGSQSSAGPTLSAEEIHVKMVKAYHNYGLGLEEPAKPNHVHDATGNDSPNLDNLAAIMRRWGIGF